ncbi:MAG: flagellar protein FlaG [Thermotogota bacterium]|nr:flagellar protein FlaG [Thermotogota bacterium]MDK2864484.1 flagellar protein FlaG [Thermotogota bacterium]
MELERIGAGTNHTDVARITSKTLHVASSSDDVPSSLEDNRKSGQVDVADLDRVVEELQKKFEKLLELFRGEAEFSVDKEIDRIVVKIKDRESGEIIRQIPPEVALKIARSIKELIGLLFDEKG